MYKTRIGFSEGSRYLDLLVRSELLETQNFVLYHTTPKGIDYLGVYDTLDRMFDADYPWVISL